MGSAGLDLGLEFGVLVLEGLFLEFELFQFLKQVLDLFLDLLHLSLLLGEAEVNGLQPPLDLPSLFPDLLDLLNILLLHLLIPALQHPILLVRQDNLLDQCVVLHL